MEGKGNDYAKKGKQEKGDLERRKVLSSIWLSQFMGEFSIKQLRYALNIIG
jgi:hypothetical protein